MAGTRPPYFRTFGVPQPALDLYGKGVACHATPVAFIPVILGALHELTYPHAWDGADSEIALTLSQVGHFIGQWGTVNTECVPNDDLCVCEPCTYTCFSSCEVDDCEDEMVACGINPNALEIRGNELWVRDPCGEWVKVGTFGGGGDDSFYEPPEIDDEVQDIYPCGMATAVADTLESLGGYIWDNSDNTLPIFMPSLAQSHIGLDLNNTWVIAAANQALLMKGVVVGSGGALDLERSDVIDTNWSERLACVILPFMKADGTADREALYAAIQSWVNGYYSYQQSANNVFIANYWTYVVSSIGSGNMLDIAVSGQFVDAGDCECPADPGSGGGVVGPTTSGWYLAKVDTLRWSGDGGFQHTAMGKLEIPQHDVYGMAFTLRVIGGDPLNNFKRQNACEGSPDFCMVIANSDTFTDEVFYLQTGSDAYAELSPLLTNPSHVPLGTKQSDIVASPLVSPFNTVEAIFGVQAQGAEGEVSVQVEVDLYWLFHTDSASHGD